METFEITTKIKFGKGALEYLESLKGKRVFIVTDPFMVKSGMINKITERLQDGNYEVFSEVCYQTRQWNLLQKV